MAGNYDYGRAGIVGIATPQANPTVEAELRILLPDAMLMVVSRLTSDAGDSMQRLAAYLRNLAATITQYDQLRPDIFGFACTASSYLVGADEEDHVRSAVEQQLGCRMVTASEAIDQYLRTHGAQRIALASPYPPALAEAARVYWQGKGYEVVGIDRIETGSIDTRSIYGLGSADAQPAAQALAQLDVDVVLLSGTGMPSLPLIAAADPSGPVLISSNLCLADQICSSLGQRLPDQSLWTQKLAAATAQPE